MQTFDIYTKVATGGRKSWSDIINFEIFSGIFYLYNIWVTLGWLDIKQRYRRSTIGPFWLTISTLIMVAALGLVYSVLFKQSLNDYLPYLAVGLIVWTFVSTLILESCEVFTSAETMIKQVRLPFTVHVMRMVWRNVIIFLHNSVVLFAVLLFFVNSWNFSLVTIPFAVLIIVINGLSTGIILGVVCTRFRDVSPIVTNVIQLTFFITPIFWKPESLVSRAWLIKYNPIHHFIDLIRMPILYGEVPLLSWSVTFMITVTLMISAMFVLKYFKHRIAYWV